MKRVLLLHSRFQAPSGVNVVAAWVLEALKSDYAVTLLTWDPVDPELINQFCGTSLARTDFETRCPSALMRLFFALDPERFHRVNYLLRVCKQINHDFDVCIATETMEPDFGCRGLQYMHYPWSARHASRPSADGSAWERLTALLRGRIRPWMYSSHFSFDRVRKNLILVNSEWTGRLARDVYGIEPRTVYPPVPGDFPAIPWEERENSFLCIGRPAPMKRIESIIEILAAVRASMPALRLHVVFAPACYPDERAYRRRLDPLLRVNASWVVMHERLSRDDLVRLASGQRYGIHAQVDEHFGIAVAEMVRAGCIPFVHDSGGQVEIVGRNPHLLYTTTGEAVRRITSVLEDPTLQADLRRDLDGRKPLFSTGRFVDALRQAVRDFLDSGGKEFVEPAPI